LKKNFYLAFMVCMLVFPAASLALPTATTIDGSLADWGVNLLNPGGGATWVPVPGVNFFTGLST
jgi:hypothetical protein